MLLLDEPRSVVLHLEKLDAVPAPFDAMLGGLLPLSSSGVTAHGNISNKGASWPKNHTDGTECHCAAASRAQGVALRRREREELVLPWLPLPRRARSAKTSMCRTYCATDEMASDTSKVRARHHRARDAFHLPRRTIHSARAVGDELSVHRILGMKCAPLHAGDGGSRDRNAQRRRRLADPGRTRCRAPARRRDAHEQHAKTLAAPLRSCDAYGCDGGAGATALGVTAAVATAPAATACTARLRCSRCHDRARACHGTRRR